LDWEAAAMRERPACVLCLLMLAFLLTPAEAAKDKDRKVYRWVDDQGVVHFGDSVPAEHATSDREILNKYGVPIATEEGEVTAEERAAAERAAAEEKQLRELEAAKRARDDILLNTYLSVAEIERLRDQRQELLDGQIQLTELYLESLRVKLAKLQKDAKRFRPYNKDPNAPPLHENLAKELSNTLDSIISYEQSLEEVRDTKEQLIAKFDDDISRFRELKDRQQANN
jgi:hypothetical protein